MRFETTIYDLDVCETNERNGIYGGQAGDKEGITFNNQYWIVKYPKSTKGMRGELISYTTTPLSEYIGSHIYEILEIPVHETVLGIRNNKLVVACKDFCEIEGSLREIRTIKNIYNKDLAIILENSFSSTSSSKFIDLDEMFLQFEYNPILKCIQNIKERFWDMFIVDILISNNDRNNSNWGVLYKNNKYVLAPVFDNGASFSNKYPDSKLEDFVKNESKMLTSLKSSFTTYQQNGKPMKVTDISNLADEYFLKELNVIIPKIESSLPSVCDLIYSIPISFGGIDICSQIRKEYYVKSIQLRFEKLLKPKYLQHFQ